MKNVWMFLVLISVAACGRDQLAMHGGGDNVPSSPSTTPLDIPNTDAGDVGSALPPNTEEPGGEEEAPPDEEDPYEETPPDEDPTEDECDHWHKKKTGKCLGGKGGSNG